MESRKDTSLGNSVMLCDAAVKGDVNLLHQLLLKDVSILHRPLAPMATVSSLPLHIACRLGHLHFVAEVLRVDPDLSDAVDPLSTPLHLAARNGHVDLVKCLVSTNPDICFARNSQGRNPVHVAAARNCLAVLDVLTGAYPAAARERVAVSGGGGGRGDTVLHLCVKQENLEALKYLVERVGDEDMLNAADGDGNTILHLAVINKQLETIKFLLNAKPINKNATNTNGMTPMDILNSQQHDSSHKHVDELSHNIKHVLKRALAISSVDMKVQKDNKTKYFGSWIEHQRSTLMVVASLVATMAFQAAVNPPGGVWQEDSPSKSQNSLAPSLAQSPETAGISIMADRHEYQYHRFFIANVVAFMSALTSILLLISELPCKRLLNVIVMITMWVAISATAYVYSLSLVVLVPHSEDVLSTPTFEISVYVWLGVMAAVFFGHSLYGLGKMLKFPMARTLWWRCWRSGLGKFNKKNAHLVRN